MGFLSLFWDLVINALYFHACDLHVATHTSGHMDNNPVWTCGICGNLQNKKIMTRYTENVMKLTKLNAKLQQNGLSRIYCSFKCFSVSGLCDELPSPQKNPRHSLDSEGALGLIGKVVGVIDCNASKTYPVFLEQCCWLCDWQIPQNHTLLFTPLLLASNHPSELPSQTFDYNIFQLWKMLRN